MAPCSSNPCCVQDTAKDGIKLRKPMVEKLRRDRINTCIEQLKNILEKEFRQQEPNSKLEKADILEMTVSFLRQQLHKRHHHQHHQSTSSSDDGDFSRSKSHCRRDSLHFLSAQQQMIQKSSYPVCSPSRGTRLQESGVWRPW
ncbi:transcription factor HES-5-like [Nerophis lumbriciformis]|uniref:transcription factor HES-5-like n=1 Tax=Nerophis lumbriciformis TaxID=546530 RepID=UPI002ADF98BE|nr:transcription factor HES-5-like [Nerophis lumbriciformis]